MENMRRRRGDGERANTSQAVYEDFQPISDWANDSNNHILLVDLPGFKKEELKLQMDNYGRLAVCGQRQLTENKFKRFVQVYTLPIDSDMDKISGKFDGGVLFVIIPKKETAKDEEPKEQHPVADGIAEEHKKETSSKTEEKLPETGEPQQETTTTEEKPKKDGKDNSVNHDNGNGIDQQERKRVESIKGKWKWGLNEWKGFQFGFAENATERIARNKGVVLAAILGLAVGIYISHKLRSTDVTEAFIPTS